MYWVYVLFSADYQKIYIGYTSNVEERLKSHNVYSKKGWTIKYRPWSIIYKEGFETKQIALKREKELKSAKGRMFIWNQIKMAR